MDINCAIASSAMEMQSMQLAAQYSTGVMAMEMDAMEDISAMLIQQMLQLPVGDSTQMIDILA